MRRHCEKDLSTLLAALLAVLSGAVIVAIAAASLACPPLKTDRFSRLTKPQSAFCVATNEVNRPRYIFLQILSTLLSLSSTVWAMNAARRAYSKFLVNGGVSAVYARMLLRELGALTSFLWWVRHVRKEPGSKNMKRLKVATIAASGFALLTAALVHAVIGGCYDNTTIRNISHHMRTTSLPMWLNYESLKAAKWEEHSAEVTNTSDYRNPICQGNLTEMTACQMLHPVTYNGVDRGISYSPKALPAAAMGSKLPVLTTINRNAGNETILMAYIVTSGQILDPVPEDASDFQIEQELLLIQRLCRMTNGKPVDLVSLADIMPDPDPLAFWGDLSKALPYHQLPRRKYLRAEAGGPGVMEVYQLPTTDAQVAPVPAAASAGSLAQWLDAVLSGTPGRMADATEALGASDPSMATGAPGLAAPSSQPGPVQEQYKIEYNTTHFRMWTLSPDYGIMCRTELKPYRGVLRMSTALTVPYLAPETCTDVPFSPPVLRLFNATVAATDDALQRLEQPFRAKAGQQGVSLDNILAGALPSSEVPVLPTLLSSCYNQDYFANGVYEDSCVSTEIDKVFSAYLLELATMDKSRWDFPPGMEPVVGGMLQGSTELDNPTSSTGGASAPGSGSSRAHNTPWDWGPVVARSIPNKAYHVVLALLTILTVATLILLHWMTSPFTGLSATDMPPEGFRDATPWLAYADAEHPPAALKGIAGLPVDQAVKEEGSRGIIVGLVPIGTKNPATAGVGRASGAAQAGKKQAAAQGPTQWVFTVEQGWQLVNAWHQWV